ncbi:hypothetical protein LCGC14_1106870 [marine sediment metagenome]|uniref:Uncharacterized protein n=1 Tax=marine sediment metagenome TaxID=412755 RepID=A0A0F9M7V8_9ZZZZ
MTDTKVFRVDIIISQYSDRDEGFWNIKENMETTEGVKQLTKTLESVYFNVAKYLEKRFKE